MTTTYTALTPEERARIAQAHVLQAEADHFVASLNAKKAAAAAKAETDVDIKKALQARADEFKAQAKRALSDAGVAKKVLDDPSEIDK